MIHLHEESICRTDEDDLEFSKNTIEIILKRNSLGFGFSICGGPDAAAPWTNLIRVKKIFPLQPAWESGNLKTGDILVKVCGRPMRGLTIRRAVDILRASPPLVTLTIYRPYHHILHESRDLVLYRNLAIMRSHSQNALEDTHQGHENSRYTNYNKDLLEDAIFVVQLKKVNGGLGFTLNNPDETGSSPFIHTVKALVRDPALSDGRLKPGDRLLSANGVDCQALTHLELITFLRSCPDTVAFEVFRSDDELYQHSSHDAGSSSSTERFKRPSAFMVKKANSIASSADVLDDDLDDSQYRSLHHRLRHEAKEMVRSRNASRGSLDRISSPAGSSCTSRGSANSARYLHLHGRRKPHQGNATSSLSLSVWEHHEDAPVIETPLSPDCPQLPSFEHCPNPMEQFGQLTIEEVSSQTLEDPDAICITDIQMMEAVEEMPRTRPNQLPLFIQYDK